MRSAISALYAADQAFDLAKIATEIAVRIYLTIGFAAVLGLAALAATSTDGMIRRLGARRWQRLHRLVYVIALLAVVHYCMQSKLDLWEPTIMAGIYAWLILYRVLARPVGARSRLSLVGVAVLGRRGRGADRIRRGGIFLDRLRRRSDAASSPRIGRSIPGSARPSSCLR